MVEQEEKGTRFLMCKVVKSVALKSFFPNHFFPYLCHTSGETTPAAFYFFLHSHRSIKEARHYTGPDFSSRQSQWCKQNTSVSINPATRPDAHFKQIRGHLDRHHLVNSISSTKLRSFCILKPLLFPFLN